MDLGLRPSILQPLLAPSSLMPRGITAIAALAMVFAVSLISCTPTNELSPQTTSRTTDGEGPWRRVGTGLVAGSAGRANDVVTFDDLFLLGGGFQGDAVIGISPDGADWSLVDHPFGQELADGTVKALATDQRVVVALLDVDSPDGPGLALAASSDGKTWHLTRLRGDTTLTGVAAEDVISTETGFVAFGGQSTGGDDPRVQTIVLTSVDGLSWEIASPDALDLEFARGISAATLKDGVAYALAASPGGLNGTIVSDPNGVWRADLIEEVKNSQAHAIGVVASNLAVGGCIEDPGGVPRPTIWLSENGGSWRTIQLPGQDGCVSSIISGEKPLAVGTSSGRAAVWARSQGGEWSLAGPATEFEGPRGAVAAGAAQEGAVVVAVGYDLNPIASDSLDSIAIWRTP